MAPIARKNSAMDRPRATSCSMTLKDLFEGGSTEELAGETLLCSAQGDAWGPNGGGQPFFKRCGDQERGAGYKLTKVPATILQKPCHTIKIGTSLANVGC